MEPKNTKDIKLGSPKILLYGPSGSGKTHFLGTVPNIFIVDFDQGLLTVRDKEIPYVQPSDDMDGIGYQDMLEILHPDSFKWMKDNKITAMAWDGLSGLSRIVIRHCCRLHGEKVPTWPVWGCHYEKIYKIVQRAKEFPGVVIFTALQRILRDEKYGDTLGGPDIPGQMGGRITAMFDYVFHTITRHDVKGSLEYLFVTVPEGGNKWPARSRYGELAQFEVIHKDNGFAELMKKIGSDEIPKKGGKK